MQEFVVTKRKSWEFSLYWKLWWRGNSYWFRFWTMECSI